MSMLTRFMNLRRTSDKIVEVPRRGFSFNAGVPVTTETAMQVSAYNRGVIYISSQIAKLPWNVKDRDNKLIDDDISFLLAVAPNPEMSSMDFRMQAIQNAIHHGNSFAEIERNGAGRPVAIWPIKSERVTVMRTNFGGLVYRVNNTTDLSGSSMGETYLPPRDVFHVKNFHTKDGIVGQGTVAYGTEILGISMGADKLANALFNNGGLPSGTISVTGTLSDEAYEKIKRSWKEAHSGRRAGGVAVLEEGAKYDAVSFDPSLLQFLESRKFNVIEIARFLGIPPTKLFDTQAATYSNTENANLEVVTDTLDAWAKQLDFQADIKILNNRFGGRKSDLDLYEVSRGDMATRAKYFQTMMSMGSITSNEIRRKEGLAPYADGDKFYIAANNLTPTDRVNDIVDAQIKGKTTPAPGTQTLDNPKKNELTEDDKEMTSLEIKLLKKFVDEK